MPGGSVSSACRCRAQAWRRRCHRLSHAALCMPQRQPPLPPGERGSGGSASRLWPGWISSWGRVDDGVGDREFGAAGGARDPGTTHDLAVLLHTLPTMAPLLAVSSSRWAVTLVVHIITRLHWKGYASLQPLERRQWCNKVTSGLHVSGSGCCSGC